MSCRVGAWFRRVRQAVFIAKNGCNGCNGRCNGRVPASQILLLLADPTVVLLLLFNTSTLFSPQRSPALLDSSLHASRTQ